MNISLVTSPDAIRLRRAVRALNDPPSAPVWNGAELIDQHAPPPLRAAAVLVPFVCHADELTVLFTQRSAQMRQHAGQISFPGGGIDAGDADALDAAVREMHEETGINRSLIEPFGYLDCFDTVSGYSVTPVAAFVRENYCLRLQEDEVEETFEVPLAFLLDPASLKREHLLWRGVQRDIFAFEWQGRRIWGATAAVLKNLLERLEQTP